MLLGGIPHMSFPNPSRPAKATISKASVREEFSSTYQPQLEHSGTMKLSVLYRRQYVLPTES
jgi:hypothetical protein